MAHLLKIVPNLWFDTNAKEAANYYVSIFKNSSIGKKTYYSKVGYEFHKMPEGTLMTIEFTLEGIRFVGINGGPVFKFNESVSFLIECNDQEEVDYFWEKLGADGDPKAQVCGWLKDKFGLSWQVTPAGWEEMLQSGEQEKIDRALQAMFKMKKLDIAELEQAYTG